MMERATDLSYICLISRSLKAPLRTAIYGLTLVAVLLAGHAQAQQQRTSQQLPRRIFLNLHYDYWDPPRQEVAGKAIDLEYAQVVMAAFNRLGFKPEELKVEPLFSEIVDRMREKNLTESLAILSLINQYNTASARFLGSNFFKVISRRNLLRRSTYSLARLITVELLKTDGVILPQVYQSINELARLGGRRTGNFRITAFPVEEAFVVGNLVEGNQTITPPQLLRCEGLSTKIGIISDNFITRSDIPQLTRLSVLGAGVPNCDGTSYRVSQEAHGTNLAGVVASICPNCQLLGYDIGCAQKSKSVFSTNDLMRAIINAMLRDVAVVILPNAERNFDRLLSNIVNIAQDAAMVVVAPAGDKGFNAAYYPFFPAAFPGVFGVVALGPDRQAAPFSNQGPWAISSALGVGVTTTHTSNSFISMSSTAIAAARFAGLVGRYFAANQKASSSSLARAQNTQQFQLPSQDACLKLAAGGPEVPVDELGEDGSSSQTPLCPSGANDLDQDGTLDCLDGCHTDPFKTSPGQCGCGIPDVDRNSNGIVDCRERSR